ncbi:hypothetical protein [Saccharothrix xinjiangensis]|uniref:hypothetical protein n=2 Tax=Saccharothrix xinjiangensis TaxID=204798 RepID=UPI003CD070B7
MTTLMPASTRPCQPRRRTAGLYSDRGYDHDRYRRLARARDIPRSSPDAASSTAPAADEPGLIVHVRTDNSSPWDSADPYLAALVRGLGGQTSAAVFDTTGDQIAHFVHPAD